MYRYGFSRSATLLTIHTSVDSIVRGLPSFVRCRSRRPGLASPNAGHRLVRRADTRQAHGDVRRARGSRALSRRGCSGRAKVAVPASGVYRLGGSDCRRWEELGDFDVPRLSRCHWGFVSSSCHFVQICLERGSGPQSSDAPTGIRSRTSTPPWPASGTTSCTVCRHQHILCEITAWTSTSPSTRSRRSHYDVHPGDSYSIHSGTNAEPRSVMPGADDGLHTHAFVTCRVHPAWAPSAR